MHCSLALLFLGIAVVLLSEIQWASARHTTTVSVEQILDHLNKHLSAAMCAAILKFDCSQHKVTSDETVCGSDHVTYHNHCTFVKARCQPSSFINLKHKGPCGVVSSPASHMTTATTSSVTWGHDPAYDLIKDVFCSNINSIICGNNVDSDVCATDGKVYTNQCLFAKVKCFEPNLELTNPSKCHENGLPLKSTPKPVLVG